MIAWIIWIKTPTNSLYSINKMVVVLQRRMWARMSYTIEWTCVEQVPLIITIDYERGLDQIHQLLLNSILLLHVKALIVCYSNQFQLSAIKLAFHTAHWVLGSKPFCSSRLWRVYGPCVFATLPLRVVCNQIGILTSVKIKNN